ncbi:hypothetical protein [Legionella sp. W05-934-2]|jgi:hypothetical protein|uniref:hypothetical protein n=1 Tax=Legionella sp. W05-934-2 TaxID=1198649 RepID=UPI003461FACE
MPLLRNVLVIGIICFSAQALGGPLFTGPLLARSGHTIPAGHYDFEPYFFYTENTGLYTRHWHHVHSASSTNIQVNPLYTYGLNDWMDVQFLPPYTINQVNKPSVYHRFSDVSVLMGFQLLEQHDYWPDFRLSISETLPTGKYENINALKNNITGLGSYQTTFGFNFQYLYHFFGDQYLRTRLVMDYNYASNVKLNGRNTYGGYPGTTGTIHIGSMVSADLAFEYTWTRHWAAVMEGYISHRQATRFNGRIANPINMPAIIGHLSVTEISIAPAMEYNWNEHIGIIIGQWLTITGKDTVDFTSTVVALNIFW